MYFNQFLLSKSDQAIILLQAMITLGLQPRYKFNCKLSSRNTCSPQKITLLSQSHDAISHFLFNNESNCMLNLFSPFTLKN